ncbi:MAG: hypothetical protein HY397_00065 [Candidatus Doudnabacteria bacterium]|nr:hypothetical protein [Candidatus Doudnabacteria bacterium]
MIFKTLTPQQKKKSHKITFGVGVLFLILGFVPGIISYQAGIIIFIFSLVIIGVVETIVPEPDPADSAKEKDDDNEEGPVEKILKG